MPLTLNGHGASECYPCFFMQLQITDICYDFILQAYPNSTWKFDEYIQK